MSYNKLLEIKKDCRLDYFVMACSYFFDIGYTRAKAITEEDIKNAKENGIMTRDFVQWLVRETKEIADACDHPAELVQFCMAEDIYDIRQYANKLPLFGMEKMLKARISQEKYKTNKQDDLDELTWLYDCDEDDFETLGFELPEEE